MSHMPPVPEANRSHAGTGEPRFPRADEQKAPDTSVKPDQKGKTANTRINLTPQASVQQR